LRNILGIAASEEPCDIDASFYGLRERDMERVVGTFLRVAESSESTVTEAQPDDVAAVAAIAVAATIARTVLTCRDDCNADMIRASGDVVCAICDRVYRKHPRCRGHYDRSGEYYWLHVLCDGLHVKL
jgi:hypothetical protein